ncbi:MAG: hypoxanthine phosphoribosyltransferase [Bacillota bacterium]
MHDKIGEVLFSVEQINERVKQLGEEITRDYAGKKVFLLGILKGSMMFMADLMRTIDLPVEVDYMCVSSYGASTTTSGTVRILKDLDANIEGKNVIIIEDIIDTGVTLSYLVKYLQGHNPNTLKICTMLNKPERRTAEVAVHYNGFDIPDKFVVGYGLDFAEEYRNLPYIGVLKPSAYSHLLK